MFIDLKWSKQYFLCSNQFSWRKSQELPSVGAMVGGGALGREADSLHKKLLFFYPTATHLRESLGFFKAKQFLPLIAIGLALGP